MAYSSQEGHIGKNNNNNNDNNNNNNNNNNDNNKICGLQLPGEPHRSTRLLQLTGR